MRVKYTYPVETHLKLTDHWPIRHGDFTLDWICEGHRVKALAVSFVENDPTQWPELIPPRSPGGTTGFHFKAPRKDEVESLVRRSQGLVALYRSIHVDFDQVNCEWLPEDNTERERLKLLSVKGSVVKPDLSKAPPLSFDLVARSILGSDKLAEYEIPLSFYRKASLDFFEDRYIEAFYGLYFFLETLFGGGHSKNYKVTQSMKLSSLLREGIEHAKRQFARVPKVPEQKQKLLSATVPEVLIDYFVRQRGELHHHTLRKPNAWHPEKLDSLRFDCIFWLDVCHHVAFKLTSKVIFSPEIAEAYVTMSEEAGVMTTVKFLFSLETDGVQEHGLEAYVKIAAHQVDHDVLARAERTFRDKIDEAYAESRLLRYEGFSEDGGTRYCEYRCYIPVKALSAPQSANV